MLAFEAVFETAVEFETGAEFEFAVVPELQLKLINSDKKHSVVNKIFDMITK